MADISIINKDDTDYKVKDAAGRLALAEVENKGAKNLVNAPSGSGVRFIDIPIVLQPGEYHVLFQNTSSTDTDASTCQFTAFAEDNSQAGNYSQLGRGNNIDCALTITKQTAYVRLYASNSYANGANDTVTFTGCMICTKAEWDISQAYVPYGKTNAELTAENTSQQAEINYAVNTGVKNLFNIDTAFKSTTIYHATASMSEGTISAAANGSYARVAIPYTFKSGASIFSCRVSSYILAGSEISLRFATSTDSSGALASSVKVTGNGIYTQTITVQDDTDGYVIFYMNNSPSSNANSANFSELMIRPAEITDQTYEPYALPNPTLTPAVIKAVDEGAKNLFPNYATSQNVGGVTFTVNSDGSITANGTKTNNDWLMLSTGNSIKAGTYVLSDGIPIDTTDCQLIITTGTSLGTAIMATAANARPKTTVLSTDYAGLYYAIRIASGKTVNNLNFKPMLCTAAEWAVSQKFVPYAPTNRELYETVQPSYDFIFGLGTALQSGDNLNTYNEVGKIYAATGAIAATILNTPWTLSGFTVFTIPFLTTSTYMQFLLPSTITGKWYRRRYTQGAWSAWIEYNEAAINGLLSNIDSSTTITAYVDSLAKGHYTSFIANTNRPSDAPVADNTFIEIYIYSASTALIRAFPTGSVYGNQSFQKSKVSGVWRNWIKFEGTEVT